MIPFTQPAPWPDFIPLTRFASTIRKHPASCRIALLGLPDDLGVRLNNGRPGAKDGPRAFRDALARYGVSEPHAWDWPHIFDAGDIAPAEGQTEAALHETHRRITEATSALLDLHLFPIAIGGGHDLTYPFVRAVAARHPGLAGIYFDAHLDVRETVGSGMPFRRLIESHNVRPLHIHGFRPLVNSREHTDYFTSHDGVIDPPGQSLPGGTAGCFASFDMDVLDAAFAPGVSAINPCGWTPAQAESWMITLGASPRVRCFDIMELNPAHDDNTRSARLAAHLFLSFLRGFADRPIATIA
ncbi:MAG: formimidoylglutamase [Phycisphaeraceae bacterium]|nr:formimidoylglutamase [Phycisphaeraceae bacterium]